MRKFANKQVTKKVEFMDGELEICKLTAGQIKQIGKDAKKLKGDEDDKAFKELVLIFKQAIILEKDEEPITTEVLEGFSFDTLAKLSQDIMDYAGVPQGQVGNAN